MVFADFVAQITRPYWSPVHPIQYVSKLNPHTGWGHLFPDDIGTFNLTWLVSGVGGPPTDYERFVGPTSWIIARRHWMLGRHQIHEVAARQPIRDFALTLRASPAAGDRFGLIMHALELRL